MDGGPAIDRLQVLVSGDGVEKLLAVPSLSNGIEEAITNAVVTTHGDRGVERRVMVLSFDATVSNTGLVSERMYHSGTRTWTLFPPICGSPPILLISLHSQLALDPL